MGIVTKKKQHPAPYEKSVLLPMHFIQKIMISPKSTRTPILSNESSADKHSVIHQISP